MFGMGLALRFEDFGYVLKAPKAMMIGIFSQIILLPSIALFIAIVFGLSPELAVGLMIISFAPSGTTSNMFSNLAKGDVALSISMTAISALITTVTIPLFTLLSIHYFLGSDTHIEIPLTKMIIQLFFIVILPVSIGMFILEKWQEQAHKMEPFIRIFSIIFLFFIVMAIIFKNKANIVEFFMQTGAATLSLNILALGLGYGLARFFKLSQKQAISIGYEVGIQNGALALIISGTIIGNATMMIPAVIYSLWMFLTGSGFYLFLRKDVYARSSDLIERSNRGKETR